MVDWLLLDLLDSLLDETPVLFAEELEAEDDFEDSDDETGLVIIVELMLETVYVIVVTGDVVMVVTDP